MKELFLLNHFLFRLIIESFKLYFNQKHIYNIITHNETTNKKATVSESEWLRVDLEWIDFNIMGIDGTICAP